MASPRQLLAALVGCLATLAMAVCAGCSSVAPFHVLSTPFPAATPDRSAPGAPREVSKPYQFPEKLFTLLVASPRGANADTAARLLVPGLEKVVGQPVVVVNREGGDGLEAWTQLKQVKPDGYTLGLLASPQIQSMVLDPVRKVPFAMADFVPMANHTQDPGGIFVQAGSSIRNLEELMALVRTRPDRVSLAVAGGSATDLLATAEFQQKAGLKMRVLPFVDASAAALAVANGGADAGLTRLSALAPPLRQRQVRLLAVLAESRLNDQPEVPTLRERGIEVVSHSALGYAVPRGTAPDIVEYLGWVFYEAVSDREHQARVQDAGLAVRYLNADQYARFLAAEAERLRQTPLPLR